MSLLFFLLSLGFGWLAWNLYHPHYTNPKLAVLSFAAGLTTGELAPHAIFWQVMAVAFFVLIGAVWGLFGAVGFLICAASWAAIALYYYRGVGAEKETEAALQAGLGKNYRQKIAPRFRERFAEAPDKQLIRHPFRHHDPDVELVKNVPFGDFGQKLDIRLPKSDNESDRPRPVLLQIHGGAWMYGRKHDGQGVPLMNHMAKRGWICIASAYRLSPNATFPDHIIDCKQALVWIKQHIHEYGGDPNFVVVTGGSAGGHLSSLLALSANNPAFQPGFEDEDTSVQGMVPFYGVFDFTDSHGLHPNTGIIELLEDSILKQSLPGNEESFQAASPIHHISADAPPAFIIHGNCDTLVPIDSTVAFVEELRKTSRNKIAYLEVSQAQHAFDVLPSIRSEHVKFGVERFLAWTYSQYLKSD